MAAQIRAFPWETTPLGAIANWPSELIFVVNQTLYSPLPGCVFWGPEFFGLYNDGFLPALAGKHPASLGRPAREVWAEVWSVVGPQLRSILANGAALNFKAVPFDLLVNGAPRVMYWDYAYSPIRSIGGQILGVLSVAQDVTAAVLAEQERDKLMAQLSGIQEATTDSILTIDRNWTVTYLNGPARAAAGPLAEAIGKNFWEQYPHTVYEGSPYVEHYRRAMEQGIGGEFEAYYPAPLEIWLEVRVRPSPDGIVLFFRNITSKKNEQTLLQSTAERLRLAQASGQISVWDWHLASDQMTWTESRWTWGRPPEELATGEICFRSIHPDDLPVVEHALAPAKQELKDYQCEFRTLWPDGTCHWVVGKGHSSSPDESGRPTRLLGVLVDISERKLSEAALIQNEKLAAVGRLASSIAHEINNPLESITNLIYLVQTAPEISPETRGYVATADRELRRVSNIVSQTLRFHKQASSPTVCSGSKLFGEALSIYQGRTLNAHISVHERYRAERGVACFEGEIRQVLSNLVANAIDAMPVGGRLFLRSRAATHPSTGRPGLRITVADTGTGMSAEVQAKLFEAFYSTKGINGTGLGLWISREIVDRHHGTLTMRSSQEKRRSGTVFSLFLPVDAATRQD